MPHGHVISRCAQEIKQVTLLSAPFSPTFLPPAVLPVYSTGKGLEASGVSQDSLMKYTLSNIQQGSSVLWCAAAKCHASAHLPAPPGLPSGPARAYPHARTPCSACSAG